MAKISSNNQVVIHNDKTQVAIVVDVFYTTKDKFYIIIPNDYKDVFENMDPDERPFTKAIGNKGYNNYKMVVWAETEKEALDGFKKTINQMAAMSIKERPVIILHYDGHNPQPRGAYDDDDFPQLQLRVHLSYCTEVSLPNSKPKYYRYHVSEFLGKNTTTRREINLSWHTGTSTVIDDTPENRAFLESIYSGTYSLIEALKKYTATPDTLMDLIQSKQKLIG